MRYWFTLSQNDNNLNVKSSDYHRQKYLQIYHIGHVVLGRDEDGEAKLAYSSSVLYFWKLGTTKNHSIQC